MSPTCGLIRCHTVFCLVGTILRHEFVSRIVKFLTQHLGKLSSGKTVFVATLVLCPAPPIQLQNMPRCAGSSASAVQASMAAPDDEQVQPSDLASGGSRYNPAELMYQVTVRSHVDVGASERARDGAGPDIALAYAIGGFPWTTAVMGRHVVWSSRHA